MLDILLGNTTAMLILFASGLLAWYIITLPSMRNMPPGPFPLPVIGNFWMVRKPGVRLTDVLSDLKNKYGKIFTIKIGSKPFVFISDTILLQEAFVEKGDITSIRPHNFYVINKIMDRIGVAISFGSGEVWKELRRVSQHAFKDFGVGKHSVDEKVLEEVNVLLDIIGQQKGEPVMMKSLLDKATSNVIASIMFGSRFEFDDSKFNLLLKRLSAAMDTDFIFMSANYFPLVRYFSKKAEAMVNTLETTSAYIKELVADHEDTFDPENIRDFVDLVLKMKNTLTGFHFNDVNMRRAIVDIFTAGSEPTSMSLQWLLLLMAAYPDVQKRCQSEIDDVLGDKRVHHEDIRQLKFIEATILETLRFRPVALFGLPHGVDRTFELAGYTIPRDAIVLPYIGGVHSDPAIFPEPERFDPTRWLDKNGDITGRDRLLSFSLGPRSCPGETLAKMELFLFFTSVIQFYTIQAKSLDLTSTQGVFYHAKKTKVSSSREDRRTEDL